MPLSAVSVEKFLELASENNLVIDVRSPSEFQQAHIPSALSIPLFSDEERKIIGTAYKKEGRETAVKIGLDFFSFKMKPLLEEAEKALKERGSKIALVHCWRGGMRSSAVAWLLDLYGYKVYTLKGGYKSFRNWVLSQFLTPCNLIKLSGCTGSGKTDILRELEKTGEPVIDLEKLANHRGSAFGDLGMPPQPRSEMFENLLAVQLNYLCKTHPGQPIWVEDESCRIGNINIPFRFFEQMKAADSVQINIPFEDRLNQIIQEYGSFSKAALEAAVIRIQRRLGGDNAKQVIAFLENGNTREAFKILLQYYDKVYQKGSCPDSTKLEVSLADIDPRKNAVTLSQSLKTFHSNDGRNH